MTVMVLWASWEQSLNHQRLQLVQNAAACLLTALFFLIFNVLK